MRRECREHFLATAFKRNRKLPIGMRHARAVMHVRGLLTRVGGEKTIPAFPVRAQPAILRIWLEAHVL